MIKEILEEVQNEKYTISDELLDEISAAFDVNGFISDELDTISQNSEELEEEIGDNYNTINKFIIKKIKKEL